MMAGEDGIHDAEAFTEWKFLGFAHEATSARLIADKSSLRRTLMVEAESAAVRARRRCDRVHRQGQHQSDQPQSAHVRLTFADAASLKPVDDALANHVTSKHYQFYRESITQIIFMAHCRSGWRRVFDVQGPSLPRQSFSRW